MGSQRENQNPAGIWEQEHLSAGVAAPASQCSAAGAPVPDGERWHVFGVRKQI